MSKGGNLKLKAYTAEDDAKILSAEGHGALRKLAEELSAIPGRPQRSADSLYQRRQVLIGKKYYKGKKVVAKNAPERNPENKQNSEPHPVNGRVSTATGGMQQIKFPGGTITLQGTPRILEIIEDSQGRVDGIRWAM